MKFLGLAALTALMLSALAMAAADEKKAEVNVGDPAPTFQAKDETGKLWKSGDVVGKKVVVVYFYPADFTGGCTAQACGFRDDFKKLVDKGVEVVGVSGDTSGTHAAFKDYHKLPFTLLADEKGEVAKQFGVPTKAGGKVKIPGTDKIAERGVSIARWTFVIGKNGKIVHKDTAVKAAGDSKNILDVVEKSK
jgi:peroxiredoxin Q/BCP